jgi:16S rRNA (guanine966-N2)-methyltransferase
LHANAAALGVTGEIAIIPSDATRPGPNLGAAALVFLDPPYDSGLAAPVLAAFAARGWLAEGAIAIVELAAKEAFSPPIGFKSVDVRRYGAARLVFLRYAP